MCDSCTIKFNGKYLQQCEICGDSAHEKGMCTCGKSGLYYTLDGIERSRCCQCPEDN